MSRTAKTARKAPPNEDAPGDDLETAKGVAKEVSAAKEKAKKTKPEEEISVAPQERRKIERPTKDKKRKRDDSDAAETAPPRPNAVMYVGHIPHGFYEEQMKDFFSQFGKVTRLRLSRNKKTGKSKHYAFIEFRYPEVAEIAAESMNNYLMFGKILQCHVMKPEEVHANTFVGANRVFKEVPWQKINREIHNKELTYEEEVNRTQRLLKREEKRRERIKAAGIDYEFEGHSAYVVNDKKGHKRFD
mmetsp:Transcript_13116/g.15860  ORF Transcript_13116/g.15860 Transcript_13116/m.15860 type:complete len:245 (-) Transcript_13116:649-1383(-)|eukprot:CAMPEP_0197860160 /NCGR_PEP_ID=MMETSP1438-20131217/35335_1 /TAXON_ID=1461541 /ORGANISM="Pterosperma sp., Strain CCMP1384" /LENGTH=244 /DNA_ID=CAMNT_0043476929 /DNA_START=120 /DNA_END=854 /DNA_ORIENTATION=-